MIHKASLYSLFAAGIGLMVLSCVGVGSFAARAKGPATPAYELQTKIAIGGEGGWDYMTMDSGAHRLYVTRGTHVMVIDTDKNIVVGDIPNTPGVHGVAIAPKLGRGYTSNGRENTVTIFDLKTLKELQRVAVGQKPDAILYEPSTKRVFTYNGISNDITALDALSGKVLGTVPVGGKPEFCATDDKGTIFANVEDTDEILSIDAMALKVKTRWPINPVDSPSGLAYDKTHHLLFSVGGNQLMAVVDSITGKLVATPAIGNGPDAAVYDPVFNIALSSNGQDGTLTLVGEDAKKGFNAIGTVTTQVGARTMALDPKTHRIYLITASFKPLSPGEAPPPRPVAEPNSAVILVYGTDKPVPSAEK